MHRRYGESRNVDADDYAASTGTCSGSTGGDCRRRRVTERVVAVAVAVWGGRRW